MKQTHETGGYCNLINPFYQVRLLAENPAAHQLDMWVRLEIKVTAFTGPKDWLGDCQSPVT